MRIYIFSPHFPPQINPRSFRVKALIKMFLEQGHEVYLNKKQISSANSFLFNSKNKNTKSIKVLKQYFSFILRFLFPDRFVFWSRWMRYSSIDLWAKKPADVVITLSNPMSCHIIGMAYKNKNRNIIWIADIGDLYSQNAAQPISKGPFTNRAIDFEKSLFYICDVVVFNNSGIAKAYAEMFADLRSKFKIIYNPINVDFATREHKSSSKIRLSYFGNTYKPTREGIREINFFENIVHDIPDLKEKLEFCFVGDFHNEFIAKVQSSSIGQISKIHKSKPPEELKIYYEHTDVLINFENNNYSSLPSKLIEYKASGLAILNFDLQDTVLNYLDQVNLVYHANLDKGNALELLNFFNLSKSIVPKPDTTNSDSFENYLELLNTNKV